MNAEEKRIEKLSRSKSMNMSTIAELYHYYVGKRAWWRFTVHNRRYPVTVFFPCKIIDGRIMYGKARLLIQPVGGQGTLWVNYTSLRIVKDFSDADEEIADATHAAGNDYRNSGWDDDEEPGIKNI